MGESTAVLLPRRCSDCFPVSPVHEGCPEAGLPPGNGSLISVSTMEDTADEDGRPGAGNSPRGLRSPCGASSGAFESWSVGLVGRCGVWEEGGVALLGCPLGAVAGLCHPGGVLPGVAGPDTGGLWEARRPLLGCPGRAAAQPCSPRRVCCRSEGMFWAQGSCVSSWEGGVLGGPGLGQCMVWAKEAGVLSERSTRR